MKYPPISYSDYLSIPTLLSLKKLRSEEFGNPAYEEFLFKTVHQVYELWFQQILFDLNSVLKMMGKDFIPESDLGICETRMARIHQIFQHVLEPIDILETMTPLDFLDFRDTLYPASGFQSLQFRLIEIKLGLSDEQRLAFQKGPFWQSMGKDDQQVAIQAISEPSLFDLVEKWLQRTPYLQVQKFSFWKEYQTAVENLLTQDRSTLSQNKTLNEDLKKRGLDSLEQAQKTFQLFFQASEKSEHFRMNTKALQAALFIYLYREEAALQLPFRMLTRLQELDEVMSLWRTKHAGMALRMLGEKIGTGGSSGHSYLQNTAQKHRIFIDLFKLATFMIPRSQLPKLPQELREKLNAADRQ